MREVGSSQSEYKMYRICRLDMACLNTKRVKKVQKVNKSNFTLLRHKYIEGTTIDTFILVCKFCIANVFWAVTDGPITTTSPRNFSSKPIIQDTGFWLEMASSPG